MYITDFKYDNIWLSTLGYMVCSFNKSSSGDVSNGSNIEFTTVPMNYGTRHILAATSYPECITATFQICKLPCGQDRVPAISVHDIAKLSEWLNRRDFHKLEVDNAEYEDIYFNGSFSSIQRVELGGDTIGLTLEFKTDSPFAHKDKTATLEFENGDETLTLNYYTEVIGDAYPKSIAVTCHLEEGAEETLEMYNVTTESDSTLVEGCSNGETIEFFYPQIHSSVSWHDNNLYDDFNFKYVKLSKSTIADYDENEIYCSIPCTMVFNYVCDIKISL